MTDIHNILKNIMGDKYSKNQVFSPPNSPPPFIPPTSQIDPLHPPGLPEVNIPRLPEFRKPPTGL